MLKDATTICFPVLERIFVYSRSRRGGSLFVYRERKEESMKIVLCGFMGCGKSSVGIRLARLLGCSFIDMDKYIEEKSGRTISRIFAEDGEAYFRALETTTVAEVLDKDNVVVACGGGTVLNPLNARTAHESGGTIFFLDVPVPALKERLKCCTDRPLLMRPDRMEFIEKLHAERYPKYLAAADYVIDGGNPPGWLARKFSDDILAGKYGEV